MEENKIREIFKKHMDYPELEYSVKNKSFFVHDGFFMDFDDDRVDYTNQQYSDFLSGFNASESNKQEIIDYWARNIKSMVSEFDGKDIEEFLEQIGNAADHILRGE